MPSLAFSASGMLRDQGKRAGPLTLIVLLHLGLFHALQNGLSHRTIPMQAEPREIVAGFIAPAPPSASRREATPETEPAPAPKVPKPATKKIQEKAAAKHPAARPVPAEHSSAPKTAPQAAAPAAPVTEPATPVPPAARSAEPAASAAPKTISGVEYIQPPQPEYPPLSRRMREEGKVLLRILVNEKGRPERVEIHKPSGSMRLDEAARQAALRALFKPHLEDGRPVAVFALVPINFSLQ